MDDSSFHPFRLTALMRVGKFVQFTINANTILTIYMFLQISCCLSYFFSPAARKVCTHSFHLSVVLLCLRSGHSFWLMALFPWENVICVPEANFYHKPSAHPQPVVCFVFLFSLWFFFIDFYVSLCIIWCFVVAGNSFCAKPEVIKMCRYS